MRSCYKSKIAFFSDDPASLTDVEWYFCAPNFLPFPTIFNAYQYPDPDYPVPVLGEQATRTRWRGGNPPTPSPSGTPCGDRSIWLNGGNAATPIPGYYPGTNIARCCNPPPMGGIATLGTGDPAGQSVPCACESVPAVVYLKITGTFPACPLLPNGTVFPLYVSNEVFPAIDPRAALHVSPPFLIGAESVRFVSYCLFEILNTAYQVYLVKSDFSSVLCGQPDGPFSICHVNGVTGGFVATLPAPCGATNVGFGVNL